MDVESEDPRCIVFEVSVRYSKERELALLNHLSHMQTI